MVFIVVSITNDVELNGNAQALTIAHMFIRAYTYTHTNHNKKPSKKKRQLAHKLRLMNFNDAFCSYLFGENPITTSIRASIRLLRHECPDILLFVWIQNTQTPMLCYWLAGLPSHVVWILNAIPKWALRTKTHTHTIINDCGCNGRKKESTWNWVILTKYGWIQWTMWRNKKTGNKSVTDKFMR